MFDSLADEAQATLTDVRGRGTLTEADISAAVREIRWRAARNRRRFKVVEASQEVKGEGARGECDRSAQPRSAKS